MNIFWFIPTHGDGRYLGTTEGSRAVTLEYMQQIAQAADNLGYSGVLSPTGRSCEDAWGGRLEPDRLYAPAAFLVAIRPRIISPTAGARMAATFDRMSGGRLLINVVTGGDPAEATADGVFLSHDERYAVTDEFLTIWRRVMAGEVVDYEGRNCACKRRSCCIRRSKHRIRRCTSAAHRLPVTSSPPNTSMCI